MFCEMHVYGEDNTCIPSKPLFSPSQCFHLHNKHSAKDVAIVPNLQAPTTKIPMLTT